MSKIKVRGRRRFGADAQPDDRDHQLAARHGMSSARRRDPLVARELIKQHQPRRDHAGRRDAAHGRPRLPRKADAPAADAGGDGVLADRARRRDHAARAGAGRGRLRDQAEDRRRRRACASYAERITDKIRAARARARQAAHAHAAAAAPRRRPPRRICAARCCRPKS